MWRLLRLVSEVSCMGSVAVAQCETPPSQREIALAFSTVGLDQLSLCQLHVSRRGSSEEGLAAWLIWSSIE